MKPFEYHRPSTMDEAIGTVTVRPTAMFLGGGTNLVDHLKLGVSEPDLLVDVATLTGRSIEPLSHGGLRIGAAATNSDVAADPRVRGGYPVLAEALLAGASGQLRNVATVGGNLLQRTRCPYFQDVTTACQKRDPGTGCSALHGHNRDHAILGASPLCVATHPSDMAVALAALDAVAIVRGTHGERVVPVSELHRLPGDDPAKDTVLEHGELITAVDVPRMTATRSAYRKVRDRASYAFALVSVAATVAVEGGTVAEARIALGGVAHKPWRATVAEQRLRGAPATEDNFTAAAEAELAAAEPLRDNGFKVPMARNTMVSVLRELTGEDRA